MDGIVNVLKPPGMTSHDVVNFIRHTLNIKKAGHTGTLDPGVAGVLPVCLGKATKVAQFITDSGKSYRAEITFGRTTSTHDKYGEVLAEADTSGLSAEKIAAVFDEFYGRILQVPPMTSAVRHQGKKLYELARQGLTVERQPRPVEIYGIKTVKVNLSDPVNPRALFDVNCSKGTYIRTLCHDVGERLGCGAFMSFLVRTGSGPFLLGQAVTLEEINQLAAAGRIGEAVFPIDAALQHLPFVYVKTATVPSVQSGSRIYPPGIQSLPAGELAEGQPVCLAAADTGCLAIAKTLRDQPALDEEKTHKYVFQPVKVF
ncbi:MAG: tRNA pseudouridine(55) synthase TruB [Bacillota bacterium]